MQNTGMPEGRTELGTKSISESDRLININPDTPAVMFLLNSEDKLISMDLVTSKWYKNNRIYKSGRLSISWEGKYNYILLCAKSRTRNMDYGGKTILCRRAGQRLYASSL